MAAGKTEGGTEVKKLVGERRVLGFVVKTGIPIPPRRKRKTIAQKNLCQKCKNRGHVVRIRKRDQRNYMNKTFCFECIGRLVVKDSCDVKPQRVVT